MHEWHRGLYGDKAAVDDGERAVLALLEEEGFVLTEVNASELDYSDLVDASEDEESEEDGGGLFAMFAEAEIHFVKMTLRVVPGIFARIIRKRQLKSDSRDSGWERATCITGRAQTINRTFMPVVLSGARRIELVYSTQGSDKVLRGHANTPMILSI